MTSSARYRSRFAQIFLPYLSLLFFTLLSIVLFCMLFTVPEEIDGVGLLLTKGGLRQVLSPEAGLLDSFVKQEGDVIKKGDILAYIRERSDSEKTKPIVAHQAGIIAEILAYPDTLVSAGQPLAIITNPGDMRHDLELIGFVSSLSGKKIKPGMRALIDPSIINPHITGHLMASVQRVGRLPMSKAAIQSVIKIPEVASYIRDQIDAEPFVVMLTLAPLETHITGYQWTGPGPQSMLDSGIISNITIITDSQSLASRLWPSLFTRTGGAS